MSGLSEGATPVMGPVEPTRSGAGQAEPDLVRLAELSARLPRRRSCAMELLLATARPFDGGFPPLRPLWAQEAVHRAYSTLRLFEALGRRDRGSRSSKRIYEHRLALHLADELNSLNTMEVRRVLPCSATLREVARDLVALFGPAVGHVVLETDLMPVRLPAYRRRALVLLAAELVTNALTHAFCGRGIAHIALRLWSPGDGQAQLLVRDDGAGFQDGRPNPAASVAGALSDLLEGELSYAERQDGGTDVRLAFPVADATCRGLQHFTTFNWFPHAGH